MAGVRTKLSLNDGMTPVLRHINNAMKLMLGNLEAVQRASGKAVDVQSFSKIRAELGVADARLNEIETNYRNINDQQDKLNRKISAGTSSADGFLNKIKGIATAYVGVNSVKQLVGLSDTISNSTARLDLLIDDDGSVDDLKAKIYASAQSARADYTDVMSTVSKLGITAKEAFSGTDEIIKFTEVLNKNFIVGGASITEQASAMYQLTQAMSSGRLQGDEYRSIIENAPLLAKSIEDYMIKVKGATGTMKEWASEGMLTADVIKAAVFESASDVEKNLEQIPMTWSQVWTNISNRAVVALDPLLQKISALANDDRVQGAVNATTNAVTLLSNALGVMLDLAIGVYDFFVANWSWICPILVGITAAVIAYNVAQMALNAALLACPLTWIILIVVAIVALIYFVIDAVNKAQNTSVSATGVIVGALAAAGAFIWNRFLGLLEYVLGIINYLINPFIEIANFIGNVFTNPVSSIIYLFQGMADNVLATLQKIASALDFVFGSNMADTVQGWRDGLKDEADALVAEYAPNENYQDVISNLDLSVEGLGLERWAYTDAWNSGYSAGENLEGIFDSTAVTDYLGGIEEDTSMLASTGDKTQDELAYLRDIAEQEAINRFTTAEVKIDMTGMTNRIDSSMDIDGVVAQLTDGFVEALSTASEGVHNDGI